MPINGKDLARQARLRYITDAMPGIRRRRRGRGFTYYAPSGEPLSDPAERRRIESLAIPPAWTDVWICPLPHGHLQATGRDSKGRKQYRYHPEWNELARQSNFDRLLEFGRKLPEIRRQADVDLRRHGLDRRKVVACVIALLDETQIRVGNEAYARENRSFGLTTLRRKHVKITSSKASLRFRGKSGIMHEVDLRQPRLVRVLNRCSQLPGQELFHYRSEEDGEYHPVDSEDVNLYIQETAGPQFSAKDFRTWAGTAAMAGLLCRTPAADSRRRRQRTLRHAYEEVAESLRNTVAVCRNHYVHPKLSQAYEDGRLPALCEGFQARRRRWYSTDEQLALYLLDRL